MVRQTASSAHDAAHLLLGGRAVRLNQSVGLRMCEGNDTERMGHGTGWICRVANLSVSPLGVNSPSYAASSEW